MPPAQVGRQHIQRRTIDELQFYPVHDKRSESPLYQTTHHHLTVERDLPCLICGVCNSTLHDPDKNRYQAKQMKTHHHVIEWALTNAIDVDHFNNSLRPNLAHRHPDDPTWHYEQRPEPKGARSSPPGVSAAAPTTASSQGARPRSIISAAPLPGSRGA